MKNKSIWVKIGKILLVVLAFFVGTLTAKMVFSLFMVHR